MAANAQPGEQLFSLVRAWLGRAAAWNPPGTLQPDFWALARRHGVDGMIGALAARGADLPASLAEQGLEVYCAHSLRFRQARAQCIDIRNAAVGAGIPLGFVKGPALAPAYGDDGVRGFGDIDVLVPNGAAGRELARRCGLTVLDGRQDVPRSIWQRAKVIGQIHAVGSHFDIEFTEGTHPGHQPLHDLMQAWGDLFLLAPESGDPFPVPAPHAHLLFLLLHVAQHWFNRLVWLADFAVVMQAGPWDADWLEQAAAKLEMRKMLRAVTAFCRRHFDETLPELGQGRVGWKDGLYLAMLAPETFSRQVLVKHRKTRLSGFKDRILAALQPVMLTDLEHPSISNRHRAPRWTVAAFQYVLTPGGSRLGGLLAPVPALLFIGLVALVWAVFGRTPGRLVREARARLRDSGFDLSSQPLTPRVNHDGDT